MSDLALDAPLPVDVSVLIANAADRAPLRRGRSRCRLGLCYVVLFCAYMHACMHAQEPAQRLCGL